MFLLPVFAVYIYYEHPPLNFYIVSILMTILIPIIPTVISACIGYLIKLVSSKFRFKKIIQTILSLIVFIGIMFLSMKTDSFLENLAGKAQSINEMIGKIYYPIGLYINLITSFNIIDLIKLLFVNFMPFVIFIAIGAKYYFVIISKSYENNIKRKPTKKIIIISRKPMNSLVRKEIRRYFSSPVYMFNTSFGLMLSVIATILFCIKGQSVFNQLLNMPELEINVSFPVIYYFFIICMGALTSISSSSISLEGKTINITKSLPIGEKEILKSKILTCYIIELPFLLLSSLIFIIGFRPGILYSLVILISNFVIILLTSVIGLLANLKYPKMNASNDTEVVKQSMSCTISLFTGFIIFLISVVLVGLLESYVSIDLLLIGDLLVLAIISSILYVILMKKGPKIYKNLNV